jgi:hypothetical protein
MFLKNTKHLQQNLFGSDNIFSNKKMEKLRTSEEAAFYNIIFSNIDEDDFAPLFSKKGSRPNAPVNTLVSSIILYNKRGWSVKELFKHIDFDFCVRYALGLHDPEESPFGRATFFNFQNKLSDYEVKTGINLIKNIFDKLTLEQLKKLELKTDIQRMDSFQAMSNIHSYSRTQLLVEILIRLQRILSDSDKELYKEILSPYVSQKSTTFVYDLKKSDIPHKLEELALVYHNLYQSLKSSYKTDATWEIFERVYKEHFKVELEKITVKKPKEIGSSSLQSPDDIDATYRKKRGESYKGQAVNVTETANPDNKLNLIVDVETDTNNTDDSKLLNASIDRMKEKTPDLNSLHTDGAYGSEDNDKKMDLHNIEHVQTAVRGRKADVDIEIKEKDNDNYEVSCPLQSVNSEPTRTRHKACFNGSICSECPDAENCPSITQKSGDRVYYFSIEDVRQQKRNNAIKNLPQELKNIRPNVEATMKEFTKRFNHKGKLNVRGKFKTTLFAITMSIGINFGRIYRYLLENKDLKLTFLGKTYLFLVLFKFLRELSIMMEEKTENYMIYNQNAICQAVAKVTF